MFPLDSLSGHVQRLGKHSNISRARPGTCLALVTISDHCKGSRALMDPRRDASSSTTFGCIKQICGKGALVSRKTEVISSIESITKNNLDQDFTESVLTYGCFCSLVRLPFLCLSESHSGCTSVQYWTALFTGRRLVSQASRDSA